MQAAVVIALSLVLLGWWVVASRRHAARREQQTADWQAGVQRPDLWTSSATCVHCGAQGGLLEVVDDALQFECLACGRRHARQTRG